MHNERETNVFLFVPNETRIFEMKKGERQIDLRMQLIPCFDNGHRFGESRSLIIEQF